MATPTLTRDLYQAICKIPIIDPHSHINPHSPTSRTLDDILGYHYYTELAHSAGMDQAPLAPEVSGQERARAVIAHMSRFDNTAQYSWFLEIARSFLGFQGKNVRADDADTLWKAAEQAFADSGWENEVFRRSNLEKIFLTNDFDDPLTGFDTGRYVPCLRTDDLVFHLNTTPVRERLARATGVEAGDARSVRDAVGKLFGHFTSKGARACAISLPPTFTPTRVSDADIDAALCNPADPQAQARLSSGVFWMLAEHCQSFGLPFDLMIGVNRKVYEKGVFQGQDLFDQRTSLIQYREVLNAFPQVPFCVSVLSSGQNQELVSYSWIFPNVITSGHWWYSNIPAFIENDLRARLQAVPKTKQLGYYSDAYKLEFVLPKYNMYRQCLARVLAGDFVEPGRLTEEEAVELATLLLRENSRRIFKA